MGFLDKVDLWRFCLYANERNGIQSRVRLLLLNTARGDRILVLAPLCSLLQEVDLRLAPGRLSEGLTHL